MKSPKGNSRIRSLERLENRLMLAADWQNPARPNDVNNDMLVTPIDALIVVNDVNREGSRSLGERPHQLARYLDLNGDGVISSLILNVAVHQSGRVK